MVMSLTIHFVSWNLIVAFLTEDSLGNSIWMLLFILCWCQATMHSFVLCHHIPPTLSIKLGALAVNLACAVPSLVRFVDQVHPREGGGVRKFWIGVMGFDAATTPTSLDLIHQQ